MVLVKTWNFFASLYFWQNRQEKSLWRYSRKKKNAILDYKDKEQKIEKWAFCQKGYSIVFAKRWDFFHLFIFGKIGKKKVFGDILERKNGFPDYENNG